MPDGDARMPGAEPTPRAAASRWRDGPPQQAPLGAKLRYTGKCTAVRGDGNHQQGRTWSGRICGTADGQRTNRGFRSLRSALAVATPACTCTAVAPVAAVSLWDGLRHKASALHGVGRGTVRVLAHGRPCYGSWPRPTSLAAAVAEGGTVHVSHRGGNECVPAKPQQIVATVEYR